MNTSELLDIVQHDECWQKKKCLLGVYPRDKLPAINGPRCPLAMIINSDKHDKPGQHWLALYVNPRGKISFFDSFGKSALFYGVEIDEYICDNYPAAQGVYEANRVQIQDSSSSMCGLFCVFFLNHCCRGLSMTEIVNKFEFPKNLKLNDDLLRLFSQSQLHICSDPKRCLKFAPKHHQYSLPMYKVLY